MELWIRSQDKTELVKIEEICIDIDDDGFIGVWSYGSNKHLKYYLGTYNSKERALEVLDEIQNMIKPTLINTEYHSEIKQDVDKLSFDVVMQPIEDKITYIQPDVVVYEMPNE